MRIKEQTWWPTAKKIGNIVFYVAVFAILAWKVKGMLPEKNALKPAPLFESRDILSGQDLRMADLRGKVVLLNYWATWCPPCQKEIPDLIRLQEKYPDTLQVIGVALDRDGTAGVVEFARKKGINYPVIIPDDPRLMQYGNVRSIPTSFVVDQTGQIVKVLVGFRTFVFFESAVKKYLGTEKEES